MRRIIVLLTAVMLVTATAAPVSALTPIRWDMDAIQRSVDRAVQKALEDGKIWIPEQQWQGQWVTWFVGGEK